MKKISNKIILSIIFFTLSFSATLSAEEQVLDLDEGKQIGYNSVGNIVIITYSSGKKRIKRGLRPPITDLGTTITAVLDASGFYSLCNKYMKLIDVIHEKNISTSLDRDIPYNRIRKVESVVLNIHESYTDGPLTIIPETQRKASKANLAPDFTAKLIGPPYSLHFNIAKRGKNEYVLSLNFNEVAKLEDWLKPMIADVNDLNSALDDALLD